MTQLTNNPNQLVVRTLVCKSHMTSAPACLKSLLKSANRPIELLIHDDGSLDQYDADVLMAELPNSKVLWRNEIEETVNEALSNYPACQETRQRFPIFLKLLDVPILSRGFFRFIDSDILFFRRIENLFEHEALLFQEQKDVSLCDRFLRLWADVKGPIVKDLNSGFLFFDSKLHDLDRVEWMLRKYQLQGSCLQHIVEQSIWAAICGRMEIHLVAEKTVNYGFKIEDVCSETGGIHFAGGDKWKIDRYQAQSEAMLDTEAPLKAEIKVADAHTLSSILCLMTRNHLIRAQHHIRGALPRS